MMHGLDPRRSVILLTVVSVSILALAAVPHKGTFELGGQRLFTSEDLVATIGNEADTAALVKKVLVSEFGQQDNATQVFLIRAQIRREWLPAIPQVSFTLMSDEESRSRYASCGICSYIESMSTNDREVHILFTRGTYCRATGRDYSFERTGNGWQSRMEVGGMGRIAEHCPCSAPK